MSGTSNLILNQAEQRERINQVWSVEEAERAAVQGWYWMAHPMLGARVNTLISGDPACDAYGRLERLYRERGWQLPIRNALSSGCGFGNLERDLMSRGWVEHIEAYDLAERAIEQAQRLADDAGLRTRVRYHVADLDKMDIPPGSVDAVFAHSSVHHVEALERLYAMVHAALRPGGVFHLHEFVGPTRFQWTDTQLRLVNGFLDSLPPRLRRLPSGALKGTMTRPTVEAMIAADPSEAVRSSELTGLLDTHFEVVEMRCTGGTLAHLALGDIAQNFGPASDEDRAHLERLFALEDCMIAEGEIGSDFAIITAIPRRAVRKAAVADNSAPKRSFATSLALLFAPVQRLYDAMHRVQTTVSDLEQEHSRMTDDLAALRAEQRRLATEVARLSGALASSTAAGSHGAQGEMPVPTARDAAQLDR